MASGESALRIPLARRLIPCVDSRVLALGHDGQIGKFVVLPIPVNVVHDFVVAKRSAQVLLHKITMLQHRSVSTGGHQYSVSKFDPSVNRLGTLPLGFTIASIQGVMPFTEALAKSGRRASFYGAHWRSVAVRLLHRMRVSIALPPEVVGGAHATALVLHFATLDRAQPLNPMNHPITSILSGSVSILDGGHHG